MRRLEGGAPRSESKSNMIAGGSHTDTNQAALPKLPLAILGAR